MKNFVRHNLIINNNTNLSVSGRTTVWNELYRYNPSTSTKALLLSLLIKNTNASNSSQSDMIVAVQIVDANNNIVYPLLSFQILSNKDEFYIDRTKQLIVLNPQDKIRISTTATGLYAYCSVLENVN